MEFYCDKCKKYLGNYLYGKGGVCEKATIIRKNEISLPDIICFECNKTTPQPKIK